MGERIMKACRTGMKSSVQNQVYLPMKGSLLVFAAHCLTNIALFLKYVSPPARSMAD